MTLPQTLLALACVLAISAGQLLFKKAGLEMREPGSWMTWRVMLIVLCAAVIYALATVLWIGLLRTVALSRLYMFMALSFIVVPIAGHLVFQEPVSSGFWIGAVLVIVGLGVVARFG